MSKDCACGVDGSIAKRTTSENMSRIVPAKRDVMGVSIPWSLSGNASFRVRQGRFELGFGALHLGRKAKARESNGSRCSTLSSERATTPGRKGQFPFDLTAFHL